MKYKSPDVEFIINTMLVIIILSVGLSLMHDDIFSHVILGSILLTNAYVILLLASIFRRLEK